MKANVPFYLGSWLIEGGCTSTAVIKHVDNSSMRLDLPKCASRIVDGLPSLRNGRIIAESISIIQKHSFNVTVDVRNAPIKAGFCLFCLGNKKLRPSKRMVQFFISPPESHNHVEAHLSQLNSNFKCEHPPCLVAFGSTEALTYHHLMGTHRWRLRHESPKKRKFELEDTP